MQLEYVSIFCMINFANSFHLYSTYVCVFEMYVLISEYEVSFKECSLFTRIIHSLRL